MGTGNLVRKAYEVRVLGCKVNQYEAQQLRCRLDLNGHLPAKPGEEAGVVVVHTCAVTNNAVKKSRQAVRRLQQEHPGAQVVVTGCAATENLLANLEGVSRCIAPREDWMGEFQDAVKDLLPGEKMERKDDTTDHLRVTGFSVQTRAFLKIQDGCDLGCTFCIVPRLRRKPRDKPLEMVVEEARSLAEAGHREVVVCGVSVGLYGRDTGGANLADVLSALLRIPALERIRVSSLHPNELTEDLLEVWASSPRMMPHVHLPLQSGSNRILQAMHRNYTTEDFLDAVVRAKRVLPDPSFNTDVIVGFPGETEKDFSETERVSEAVGFSRMHIFPFSARPHTQAARYPDRVDSVVIRERCSRLKQRAARLTQAYHTRYEARQAVVLAEQWDPVQGTYDGYTERYIPTRFPGPAGLQGSCVPVMMGHSGKDRVTATRLMT